MSTVTELRLKLKAAGFSPIPVRGKVPQLEGWQLKHGASADEIRGWDANQPSCQNTSILTRCNPVADVDILIAEAAEAVEALARERFGSNLMRRIGLPPKRAFVFRTSQPFAKVFQTFKARDGSEHRIEILCDGQQVVVAGIHPDTHRPYAWDGGEPWNATQADLPELTEAAARTFVADARKVLVERFGFTVTGGNADDEITLDMLRRDARRRANGGAEQSPWMLLNSAALANLSKWVPDLFGSAATLNPNGAYRVKSTTLGRSLQEDLSIHPEGITDWGTHDMGDTNEGRRSPIDVVMGYGAKSFEDAVAWLRERVVDDESERIGDDAPAGTGQQQRNEAPHQKTWRNFLPTVDMSGWDDVPVPQQEWAVQDRIPLRNAFLLSGEGAAGKSLLQLQLSVATVLRREWLGTVPQQGPAIFIDAEDPIGVIHKRLADILGYYQARFADVKDHLHLVSLAGRDAVLATFSRTSNRIEATYLYKRLLEMAGDLKPKLIGIASSADVFAGSEIDRSQVQQFVAMLTRIAMRIDGSLVLISHPSLTGMASGSGISGSTQWHNSVRARAFLHGVKAENGEPPDTDMRVLEFKKNNYGPLTESIVLKYRDGLFLPVAGTTAEQAERNQRAEDIYLLVLKKLASQNQHLAPNKHANNCAAATIVMDPAAKGFRRQDMEAAQRRLLDQRRIHIVDVGSASRRTQRVMFGPGPDPSEEVF